MIKEQKQAWRYDCVDFGHASGMADYSFELERWQEVPRRVR
jgi:hypothetical protein